MNYIRPCHVVLALLAGTLTAGPADAWIMGPMYCPSVPIDLVGCNCGGAAMPRTPNIPRVMPGFRPLGAPVGISDAARREQAKRTKIAKAILKKNPGRVISRPELKAAVDRVAAARAKAAAECAADPNCAANRDRLREKYPNGPEEKIVAAAKRIVAKNAKEDADAAAAKETEAAKVKPVAVTPPQNPADVEKAWKLGYEKVIERWNRDHSQNLPDGTVGLVSKYNEKMLNLYLKGPHGDDGRTIGQRAEDERYKNSEGNTTGAEYDPKNYTPVPYEGKEGTRGGDVPITFEQYKAGQ